MEIHSNSDVFSMRLPAGTYSIDRVQFNEGPFMAESHIHSTFQVSPEQVTYLGVWQFEVETPRTVRLVRIHLVEGEPEFPHEISTKLFSEPITVETVLPEPQILETRVFSVAPYPKVKYFYRQ